MRLARETDDDLAALIVRPTASVRPKPVRIEELEFGAGDIGRRAPERFLAACGAPEDAIERLAASARALTADGAGGVLRVAFDGETGAVEAEIEPLRATIPA